MNQEDYEIIKEMALRSIKKENFYLLKDNKTLQNDKDFLLKATIISPKSFYYAQDNLKSEKSYLKAIIKINENSYQALEYIDEELKNDKQFMLELIQINPKVIEIMGEEIRNDEQFMTQLIQILPHAIPEIGNKLKNNPDFMRKLLNSHEEFVYLIGTELRNSEGFMLELIQKDPLNIVYIGDKLKNEEFVQTVIQLNPTIKNIIELIINSKDPNTLRNLKAYIIFLGEGLDSFVESKKNHKKNH